MDTRTRTGDIYPNRTAAEAAGVPDEDLVTGSRAALEKLKTQLKFTKGSFKPRYPDLNRVTEIAPISEE